jgi:hypothetical protein
MLRELRKKTVDKKYNKAMEDFIGKKSRKFFLENNYESNFFYKYLLFLRMNGADLNKFFDEKISENK